MHIQLRIHSLDYLANASAKKYGGETPITQRDLMCLEMFSGVQSVANGFRALGQVKVFYPDIINYINIYLYMQIRMWVGCCILSLSLYIYIDFIVCGFGFPVACGFSNDFAPHACRSPNKDEEDGSRALSKSTGHGQKETYLAML
jgi:hypothetical protein